MVLHLAREFGFIDRLALGHAGEAHAIPEVLAGTDVVPVIGPVSIVRFYGDDRSHNVVKTLMDAGISVSLQTDQSGQHVKDFREYGAFLVRHGLSEEQALAALTIHGAKAMRLDDRVGSIEAGKDADLVLLDGHPFDLTVDPVARVLVDGEVEYERRTPAQTERPTAVGPFDSLRGRPSGDETTFAVTGAHIFTVSRGIIPNGTIVVENGRFARVEEGAVDVGNIPTLDIGGRAVLPGWVTARAFPNDWIGDIKWQVQNDELTEPVVPEMRARFAIDPWFPSFAVLRGIGLTAQNITPGHVNLIGGSGAFIKTAGMDVETMVRREPTCLVFSLTGASMRFWSRGSRIPVTLESASHMVRETLDRAESYLEDRSGRGYDSRLEALVPALRRDVPVIVHARTTAEIREAMSIAADYDLRLIVSGAVEAYRIAEELAAADVSVILGDSASRLEDIRGGGEGYSAQAPAILHRHGVRVSFFGPSASRRGSRPDVWAESPP